MGRSARGACIKVFTRHHLSMQEIHQYNAIPQQRFGSCRWTTACMTQVALLYPDCASNAALGIALFANESFTPGSSYFSCPQPQDNHDYPIMLQQAEMVFDGSGYAHEQRDVEFQVINLDVDCLAPYPLETPWRRFIIPGKNP